MRRCPVNLGPPERKRRLARGAVALVAALLLLSCGPGHEPLDPSRVMVATIPLGAGGAGGAGGAAGAAECHFSVPPGYAPDRAWPVVIALHGYGSHAGRFHLVWKPAADAAGCVLITPQGERETAEGIGRGWGESGAEIVRLSLAHVQRVVRCDPARVYLAGFSQGGALALVLGLSHPQVFRGLALLGTPLRDRPPLDPATAPALAGTRIYVGRGSLEPEPEAARAAVDELTALGCEVRLVEYPGLGHDLPQPVEGELGRVLEFLVGIEGGR
jgi:predicted esterase